MKSKAKPKGQTSIFSSFKDTINLKNLLYKLEKEFETKYLWMDDRYAYILMGSGIIDKFYIYEICIKLNEKDKEELDIMIIKVDWEEMKMTDKKQKRP